MWGSTRQAIWLYHMATSTNAFALAVGIHWTSDMAVSHGHINKCVCLGCGDPLDKRYGCITWPHQQMRLPWLWGSTGQAIWLYHMATSTNAFALAVGIHWTSGMAVSHGHINKCVCLGCGDPLDKRYGCITWPHQQMRLPRMWGSTGQAIWLYHMAT
jgi:hypothetical protein